MAFLKHLYNGSIVSVYELGESTIIGRQTDCNIRVEDATVSGHHARIEKMPSSAAGNATDKTDKNGCIHRYLDRCERLRQCHCAGSVR